MKTVKLTKGIPADGLVEGDVLSVDEFSAAAMIDRGDATAYDPAEEAAKAAAEAPADADATGEPQVTKYGGQEGVRTIDDIVDPEVKRNKRVMTATVVGGPADAGPTLRSPDADPAAEPSVPDTTSPGDTNTDGTTTTADTTSTDADTSDVTVAATTKTSKRGGPSSTSKSTSSEVAAPGPNPAGGDAGGGDAS